MAGKVQVQGGMGLLGWLTVAFVVLKLTGFIGWSWWLVLAPIWAPASLALGFLGLLWAFAAVLGWLEGK